MNKDNHVKKRKRNEPLQIDYQEIQKMLDEYKTGSYTIKDISIMHGLSVGKTYYLLRDNNCQFISTRRKQKTEEEKRLEHIRRSNARKGFKMSQEVIKKISEKNSCNYNGLNGYGHTKQHNQGYVLAYVPKHPNAHKDGYVMLHTVLMEQKIGRYLNADEVVHHINHNKQDNRIENLQLMTKFEHSSMHSKERHEKRRNDLLIRCI